MTGGDDKPPKSRKVLSSEDAALWAYVTRDVKRVKTKGRASLIEFPMDGQFADLVSGDGIRRGQPGQQSPSIRSDKVPRKEQRREPAPSNPPKHVEAPDRHVGKPKPVVLERRKSRRIARGSTTIDARLDLHGLTQDEAHRALTRFIYQCHQQGHRTLLVITGKGAGGGVGVDGDSASNSRGVLRRNVPRWLGEAGLRAIVSSYSSAHVKHGGDGALYVMLRKR